MKDTRPLSLYLVVVRRQHGAGHGLVYAFFRGDPPAYRIRAWMALFPEIFGERPEPIDTGERIELKHYRVRAGLLVRNCPKAVINPPVEIDPAIGGEVRADD